jgi:hypothetical protein
MKKRVEKKSKVRPGRPAPIERTRVAWLPRSDGRQGGFGDLAEWFKVLAQDKRVYGDTVT